MTLSNSEGHVSYCHHSHRSASCYASIKSRLKEPDERMASLEARAQQLSILSSSVAISLRKISSYGQFRRYLKNHLFGIWEITAQCDACFSALYKYSYLLTYLMTLLGDVTVTSKQRTDAGVWFSSAIQSKPWCASVAKSAWKRDMWHAQVCLVCQTFVLFHNRVS